MLVLADLAREKACTDDEKAEAIRLYAAAAAKGVPTAMHHLGIAYELGEGVEPDLSLALAHYRNAAEAGFAAAHEALRRLEAVTRPPTAD